MDGKTESNLSFLEVQLVGQADSELKKLENKNAP